MRRLTEKEIENIHDLAKKGKSLREITNLTGLGKTTIYYHVCGIIPKNAKADMSKISNWEKGYIIGLFFGDGNFWVDTKNYSYRIVMNFNAKSEGKIIQNALEIFRKTGCNPYTQRFENTMRITCISKVFYEFLGGFSAYTIVNKGNSKIKRKDNIKGFESWDDVTKYGFVAGVIDSDGFLGRDKTKYMRVIITTYSKNFVHSFSEVLKSLNISFHVQKSGHKRYNIRISTPSYESHKQKIKCVKGW
jgi:hypothetical protein